jgi:hypothetical protein
MIFPWTFEFFSPAMSLRAIQSTKHWHWTDSSMEGNLLLARSNWANAEQRASNYSFQSLATGKWVAAQYELGWRIVGTGTSVWPFVYSSWSDQIYPLVNIQKAIEHGPVEIVDLPQKWCFSIVFCMFTRGYRWRTQDHHVKKWVCHRLPVTFGSHRPARNRDIDIEKSPPACKLDLSKLEGGAMDELRNYLKDWGTTLW